MNYFKFEAYIIQIFSAIEVICTAFIAIFKNEISLIKMLTMNSIKSVKYEKLLQL